MSLSNTVKAIQDIMRKDAGVDGDAQRIGQLGWMLFLKIYSDLELETELEDTKYKSPIPKKFRWESWADESVAGKDSLTGDALINFINNELFPKLKELDLSSFSGQARERGALLISVFDDAYNYMKNGTLLRQVINKINQDIDYNSVETRHLFGDIYEQILRDLQNAGNAGEYYTPRAVTQFAIEMVNPQLGEIVLDPACGTGGFLTGAFEHMKKQVKKPAELKELKNSIRGVEKKPLPHVLCATNMMVHGIEVPSNILNGNTLAKPLRDYGKKDQVHVILTNPPFGGVEEDGIESNFPAEFRTKETADLFLVLVMELLEDGGRAAIVLPDGTLFGEGVKTKIKKKMLEECNLHTIVRLPKSVFAPYTTIATNILFLIKGEPTKDVWYFEHKLPEGVKAYNKTKPMRLEEFDVERSWWTKRVESEQAWKVSAADIAKNNYNLDIKNPNTPVEIHDDPDEILARYKEASEEVARLQEELRQTLETAVGTDPTWVGTVRNNWKLMAETRESINSLRQLLVDLAIQGQLFERKAIGSHGYPSNWEVSDFKSICNIEGGNQPPKSVFISEPREGYVQLFQIRDLGPNPVPVFIPEKLARSTAIEGEILIGRYGASVGKIFKAKKGAYNVALVKFIYPKSKLDSDFVYWFLKSSRSQALFTGMSRSAQAGFNKKDLAPLLIPIPSLPEQQKIIEKLNSLMEICNQLEKSLTVAYELASKFAKSVSSALA